MINKPNATNIEYIKITELFGKHDITINFEKQVNILIGEHGLGKTSVMKCINAILTNQYHKLHTENFTAITIKFKNEKQANTITHNEIRSQLKQGSDTGENVNNLTQLIMKNVPQTVLYYTDERNIRQHFNEIECKTMNQEHVKKFTDVCNSYLSDKQIKFSNKTFDIYNGNETKFVPSLGEMQMITFFADIYLNNDENKPFIILIDEPERSLCVPWQQNLIPDIIKSGLCALLVTTTHSPFVFDNDFDNNAKELGQ